MLRFIYGENYPVEKKIEKGSYSIVQHTEAYIVADKYQVKGLKIAAHDEISYYLDWSALAADQSPCLRMMFTRLPRTDSLLRTTAIRYCARNIAVLREEDDFRALLHEIPDLGSAILHSEQLQVGQRTEKLYRCPHCDTVRDLHTCTHITDKGDCGCKYTPPTCSYCMKTCEDWEDHVYTFVQVDEWDFASSWG